MKRFAIYLLFLTSLALPAIAAEGDDGPTETPVQPEITDNTDQVSQTDRAYGAYQRGMYLTAFALALPEAENGDAAAQTLIAELYEAGLGVAKDKEEAASWYGIAARSGNREAQFAYSVKLMKGDGVETDREAGIEMMKVAAEAGHPTAMFNYANHLVEQRPTSATYRKVMPLYQKAAEYRLADAYYALAQIHLEGRATGIQDPEKGRKWLLRAAHSGIDTAQVELGISLLKDKPTPEDELRAQSWFRIAANSGNVIARNRLAHLLFTGVGTKQARIEGAMWHILASRAGRHDLDLDQAMETMPADDRNKAVEWANRWPARPS